LRADPFRRRDVEPVGGVQLDLYLPGLDRWADQPQGLAAVTLPVGLGRQRRQAALQAVRGLNCIPITRNGVPRNGSSTISPAEIGFGLSACVMVMLLNSPCCRVGVVPALCPHSTGIRRGTARESAILDSSMIERRECHTRPLPKHRHRIVRGDLAKDRPILSPR